MKRGALAAGFLLFIALCGSLAYWGMQLFKPPARQVTASSQMARIDVRPEAAAALFGGRPTALAAAVNYQLKGVVVSGTANESVAILIPEGKPAKAVSVNSEISPGVVVKEVHPKYVVVSENGLSKRIELPVIAPPSTGGLSPLGNGPVPMPMGGGPIPQAPVQDQPPPQEQPQPAEAPPPVQAEQPPPQPPQMPENLPNHVINPGMSRMRR